jgi:threonine synthase
VIRPSRPDPVGHLSSAGRFGLGCDRCGLRLAPGPWLYGCPRCAERGALNVLEVVSDGVTPPRPLARRRSAGLGRYADLLPGGSGRDWISLGEGDTPLIPSRVIGPRLGLSRLYFKNETVNPTWSFKDRYVAVTVNVARTLGYRRTVVSSTGNLGVSAAAYCSAAGLSCLFLAPPDTAGPLLSQARLHGAEVVRTSSEGRQVVFEHLARHRGWFPIGLFLPRPVHNPFGIEGYRTIAYEILEALGTSPAAMLFPCARGNGLYGTWKGFRDAQRWGWASHVPAMVACQPLGANSLEVSLERGAADIIELPPAESIAASTCETVADRHALEAIRASRGTALSATDAELVHAVAELGREGLCVEPASALVIACLPRWLAAARPPADAPIVCLLTATGTRWPAELARWDPGQAWVEPTVEAVDRYLATRGLDGRDGPATPGEPRPPA